METKDIFARAFQTYGPTTSLPEGVNLSKINIPYDPRNLHPEIYCDFIDTSEFNALACIFEGQEFVALFSGITNFINPYYAAFLADSTMFLGIGDPTKTRESIELQALRIEFLETYPTLGFAPLSACPIRARATIHLISCSLLFLHAHEVAHIILGHLDLLRDEFDVGVYEELPIVPLSEEESELRKALELQADQSAALTSLHLFRRQLASDSAAVCMDADLLWSIAVETLLTLFDLVRTRKGYRTSMTHPSAFARWLSIKLSVSERAEEHGIRKLIVPLAHRSVVGQVKDWLLTKGLTSKELFSLDQAEEAMREMYATWAALEPYRHRLEHYRAFRGNRAVAHV